METTPNPWSVAKPETFQSFEFDNGCLITAYSTAQVCFLFGEAAPLGHSNHSEHPERLSSRRVVKAL